ncbi:unnamed protein product [Peronospora farinosa]|uniref:Uncharacterized protein n=1 Tax=Peronospora farinosa TaxID=134698 RepID=A0AAV0TSP4_9STRA|nr:unnamed protein product [Peronospora farinosa]CAI5725055.1 unnamed protein product [Peronospora farinosa]
METLKQDTTQSTLVDDASEKEEKSSTTSIVSHESAVPYREKPLLLSSTPRRCVSKEMLEQTPTFEINSHNHEMIVPQPFGCFHVMQLIQKSIQMGTFFSPKLFVPKEIWQQDHVKLAGIPLKIEIFHQLKHGLEKTNHALSLSPDTTKSAFIKELDALLDFTRHERVQLIRSFPFLLQDKSNDTIQLRRRGSSSNGADEGITDATSSNIGKLTNLAFGFGRMVKKQAIAAVERVGAAPSVAVSIDELDAYSAVLCMFFNSTRSIENLLGLRAHADNTQEQVNAHKVETGRSQLNSATLKKLEDLAIFLDEVVIELVMRDVYNLLEIYMRRLTRQFGDFTVEQALLKRHPSVST